MPTETGTLDWLIAQLYNLRKTLPDGVSSSLQLTLGWTDHGTPIARIIPIGRESGLEKLIRAGLVTMPTGPRHPLPEPIKTSGTVSDLIADQRR